MTASVSLLPPQTGISLAPPNPIGLSVEEQMSVAGLSTKLMYLSSQMLLKNSYYDGMQRLHDLGIAIPPQMQNVRTVVDWPRICIDPLVQRSVVDGFRMPGATDVDDELWGYWQANDLDAESPLCFLDALVYGRGYMIVGSPDEPGDAPCVTVESPLNLTLTWDPRTRRTLAAYQSYEVEGVYRAVLYLPDQTVSMSRDATGPWEIDNRDVHNFGEVPVVRFANRQRSADREGRSEITPAVMNTTDSAVRTLLGIEIAREFYSVPSRYVLNVDKSSIVDAAGNQLSGIDLALNKFIAFSAGEAGDPSPSVGQFQAFDPSVYTKIIDEHAQLMASYTGFPPSYFGQNSTANPASADAIRVAENGLIKRASQVQHQFSDPLERVMALVWRFANNGAQLPPDMKRLETDWEDAATPTPSATADAIFKQVQMGAIPATSDVTLKALGWSGVQRARLAADRAIDAGASVLAELATSLQAKEARVDTSIATDISPAAAKPAADAPVPPPQ